MCHYQTNYDASLLYTKCFLCVTVHRKRMHNHWCVVADYNSVFQLLFSLTCSSGTLGWLYTGSRLVFSGMWLSFKALCIFPTSDYVSLYKRCCSSEVCASQEVFTRRTVFETWVTRSGLVIYTCNAHIYTETLRAWQARDHATVSPWLLFWITNLCTPCIPPNTRHPLQLA
jgi:hypothetical protein